MWPQGTPGPEGWRGIVYSPSATGVGLGLPCPLRPGAMLRVEAWGRPAARPLLARVVRAQPLEHIWLCGCELAGPLGAEELLAWLGAEAPSALG